MASHGCSHVCYIVPPYLLQGIADSDENGDECRQLALAALNHRNTYETLRQERLDYLSSPLALRAEHPFAAQAQQSIVPEHLLRHIAESKDVDAETRARAARDAGRLFLLPSNCARSHLLAIPSPSLVHLLGICFNYLRPYFPLAGLILIYRPLFFRLALARFPFACRCLTSGVALIPLAPQFASTRIIFPATNTHQNNSARPSAPIRRL